MLIISCSHSFNYSTPKNQRSAYNPCAQRHTVAELQWLSGEPLANPKLKQVHQNPPVQIRMALEDTHRWSLYHISGQTASVQVTLTVKRHLPVFREMYLYLTASAPASYPAPEYHTKTMTCCCWKEGCTQEKCKTKLRLAPAFYFKRAEGKDQAVCT